MIELSGVSEEKVLPSHLTVLMGAIVVVALVVGAVAVIFCIYKRLKKTDEKGKYFLTDAVNMRNIKHKKNKFLSTMKLKLTWLIAYF